MTGKRYLFGITLAMAAVSAHAQSGAVEQLLADYRGAGASAFDAQNGKAMWTRSYGVSAEGKERRCSTCHNEDLRRPGKHVKTGKKIDPLAPSVNAERLTDVAEIEKWFKRNCEWTLGRECNAQEKGDVLAYLRNQ
jgi:hypothetical protein